MLHSKALSLALLLSFPAIAMEKAKSPQPNSAETAKAEAEKKEITIWNKERYTLNKSDDKSGEGTKENPYKSTFIKGDAAVKINGKLVEVSAEADPVIVEGKVKRYLGLSSTSKLEVKKEVRDPEYAQELKELTWTRGENRVVELKAEPRLSFEGFGTPLREKAKKVTGSSWKATEGKEKSKPLSKDEMAALLAATLNKQYAEEKAKLDKMRAQKAEQAKKTQKYVDEMERRARALQLAGEVREKYDVDEQIRLAENETAKVKAQESLAKEKEKYSKASTK